MNRTPVSSSNVASVGYEPETLVLEVEFLHGGVYQYSGVPQEEYEALISASSVGGYLGANIKNRYPCSRV
jgi:hypothetical protein